MSARDRMRRRRSREKAGRCVLRVEVDEVEVVEKLIAGGYLSRLDYDNKPAIAAAAGKALDDMAPVVLERDA